MARSIQSWILNRIRLGDSQADSFRNARARFSGVKRSEIYKEWLGSWAGKYAVEFMKANPDVTMSDIANMKPTTKNQPAIGASAENIMGWFSTIVDSPYDYIMTYKRGQKRNEEYGQWRYETGDDDTYTMIINTAIGETRRKYKLDEDGDIEPIGEIFVGHTKP